jgi:hypothetical protein
MAEPGSSTSATRSRGSNCPRLWKRSLGRCRCGPRAIFKAPHPRDQRQHAVAIGLIGGAGGEMVDSITAMNLPHVIRGCDIASVVIARSEATKQSILSCGAMDCFASLAMTSN